MNKLTGCSLIVILSSLATGVFAEGDPAAGKEKSAVCAACHGAEGIGASDL